MNALHPSWVAGRIVLATLLIAAPRLAVACLHKYSESDEHRQVRLEQENVDQYVRGLTTADASAVSAEEIEELRALAEEGDYRDRSDYAVALILSGKVPQAIELLEQIEEHRPGEYIVAANLGTAYELAGDDEQALRWITTGWRRNPESHDGTEWLHVKILEAKLAIAKDPDWLKSHSVLGVDFGTGAMPARPAQAVVDVDHHNRTFADVRKALEYQLHERLALVPPPDAVVGNLLGDLGNLLVLDGKPKFALPIYRLGMGYSAAAVPLVQRRIQLIRSGYFDPFWSNPLHVLIAIVAALALVTAGFIWKYARQFLPRYKRASALGSPAPAMPADPADADAPVKKTTGAHVDRASAGR